MPSVWAMDLNNGSKHLRNLRKSFNLLAPLKILKVPPEIPSNLQCSLNCALHFVWVPPWWPQSTFIWGTVAEICVMWNLILTELLAWPETPAGGRQWVLALYHRAGSGLTAPNTATRGRTGFGNCRSGGQTDNLRGQEWSVQWWFSAQWWFSYSVTFRHNSG